MMYNYVIFHKSCFDGFASFIVLEKSKKISKNAIIFADVPSTKHIPRDIDGKDIIIMDVAYKYEILKEIVLYAKTVTFIDHHITIHNDVLKLIKTVDKSKINIIYDENECGSSLTWKYFFKHKKLPLFLKYIHANDIGKWDMYKHTYSFITGLKVKYDTNITENNIKRWNGLFDTMTIKKIIKKGKIYKEYEDYLIEGNLNRYSMMSFPSYQIYEHFSDHFTKPGQYKVALSFCPCPDSSILGNRIMKEIDCDFVMFVSPNMEKKEYIISMRSDGVDVGSISKLFGGGGHSFASAMGLSMTKYNIDDLFLKDVLPRQRK